MIRFSAVSTKLKSEKDWTRKSLIFPSGKSPEDPSARKVRSQLSQKHGADDRKA
jgi:hypothetical protein